MARQPYKFGSNRLIDIIKDAELLFHKYQLRGNPQWNKRTSRKQFKDLDFYTFFVEEESTSCGEVMRLWMPHFGVKPSHHHHQSHVTLPVFIVSPKSE